MKKRNPSVIIIQPIVRFISVPLIVLILFRDTQFHAFLKHYYWQRLYHRDNKLHKPPKYASLKGYWLCEEDEG